MDHRAGTVASPPVCSFLMPLLHTCLFRGLGPQIEASQDQQVPSSGADLSAGEEVIVVCTELERFGIQPTQEGLLDSLRQKSPRPDSLQSPTLWG